MEIHFIRFEQSKDFRLFAFDCIGSDRSVTKVTVRADVALARKYDIRLQELPLLCSRLLAAVPEGTMGPAMTFAEADMVALRTAERLVLDKKKRRVRISQTTGSAWRHPMP